MASYQRLEALLKRAGLDLLDAAEAHGFLVGRLCTDPDLNFEEIASELLAEDAGEPVRKELQEIFREARGALLAPDFSFDLWLPKEGSLKSRAEALAEWCQGFLYGIGLGGGIAWSQEARELLSDIEKIATLQAEGEEEEERAFVELVEYLRVAVQSLIEETLQRRRDGSG